jgi:mannose-6-phosphate isomerase-like protein (cupin superfamily)
MWYRNRVALPPGSTSPNEVVFEVVVAADEVGFGVAVADINRSQKHYHQKTLETYTLVSGELQVHVGEEVHLLRRAGEGVTVPINTPHWAESTGDTPARIIVVSIPAWTPQDHILL